MIDINILNILRCPCSKKAKLILCANNFKCSNKKCIHSKKDFFSIINNIPILISERKCDTVCQKKRYLKKNFLYVSRKNSFFYMKIRNLIYGSNITTIENSIRFINLIKKFISNKKNISRKKILVIGSATEGLDTDFLWAANFDIVGIDIYPSKTTNIIADAHYLPFAKSSFDGVWIQAVLEHVVNPQIVVSEIERVLKKDGVVYAETPFMQQVHEGAYDFHRFTVNGHRYLFKNFTTIRLGGNQGPGVALAWSIKYFIWGLSRSRYFSFVVSIPFYFLLRILDRFCDPRIMFDAPSGVFFLGLKSNRKISHKDSLLEYDGFQ